MIDYETSEKLTECHFDAVLQLGFRINSAKRNFISNKTFFGID